MSGCTHTTDRKGKANWFTSSLKWKVTQRVLRHFYESIFSTQKDLCVLLCSFVRLLLDPTWTNWQGSIIIGGGW
jgi:hypothetical protein